MFSRGNVNVSPDHWAHAMHNLPSSSVEHQNSDNICGFIGVAVFVVAGSVIRKRHPIPAAGEPVRVREWSHLSIGFSIRNRSITVRIMVGRTYVPNPAPTANKSHRGAVPR